MASPALADDRALEAEIAALKARIAAQDARLEQVEAQLRTVAAAAPQAAAALAPPAPPPPASALDDSGSLTAPALASNSIGGSGSDTTIGGYGEITYNGYVHDRSRNQADLRRFVLFSGHRFNDKLSFNSEFEVEHAIASAGDRGEAEIEQAYLSYAFNPMLNLKGGLFLMPAGFINRYHEPPVFYGVERNEVETRIIPSTWREGGIGVYGATPFGLSYDAGIVTGFDVAKFDEPGAPLAGSHQELQLAKAADLSFYGSLEYNGIPGLLLGAFVFTGQATHDNADFRQNNSLPDFTGQKARVTLWDVHARWQHKDFDFEGLYTRGSISNAAGLDQVILAYNANTGGGRAIIPSAFYGWLVQGAYSFHLGKEATLSPFARYERYNTQSRLPLGIVADPANMNRVITTGLSFRPLSEVVIKADFQHFSNDHHNTRFNLGLGYMF